jgi:NO-binding membrane sensor protein with MHYT domain
MLAYDPGIGTAYNIPVTLMSLIFAVTIATIGLSIALLNDRRSTVAIGDAVVGMGVAAMHYTGMMALEVPARIVWSPGIVAGLGGVWEHFRRTGACCRPGRTAVMR